METNGVVQWRFRSPGGASNDGRDGTTGALLPGMRSSSRRNGDRDPPRAPPPRSHRATTFTAFEHPEITLSWSTAPPDKIKLRKLVHLGPLRFILRADYDRHQRSFTYGCSCRERLFNGVISIDQEGQRLEYYKRLSIAGNGSVGVRLSAGFAGVLAGRGLDPEYLSPRLTFQYELGVLNSANAPGGTAVLANNAFDIATKIPLSRSLAVEVCGAAQLPAPMAQYSIDSDRRRTVSVGSGALSFHLAELNAVLFL